MFVRTKVTKLAVGDRVRVQYYDGPINEGVVYFVCKGYTHAKNAKGQKFLVKSCAKIDVWQEPASVG